MSIKNNQHHKQNLADKGKKTFFRKQRPEVNRNFNKATANRVWIYGRHPVLLAIRNPLRKFFQLLVTENNYGQFEQILKEGLISPDIINIVTNEKISSYLSQDAVHQGFALLTNITNPIEGDVFLRKISLDSKDKLPPILIMDQLTDPHNIGAIIRSAIAFGIRNVVITRHNFPKESSIMSKSSAGMIELAHIIIAGNLNSFLVKLKDIGYWCIGLDGNAKIVISDVARYKPLAVVIGNEGNGIRNLVRDNCDLLVKIPINNEVDSLNASNAAAISLYELFGRQSQ